MATRASNELVERFEQFFRDYYRDEIGDLARKFPTDRRSLYVDWQDLYRFDPDLADDYLSHPEDFREKAEEALRLYDLPVDVKLGGAHVRLHGLPETTEIRSLRSHHVNTLIAVTGLVRKATDVKPKIQNAAFECQRCGTLTRVPQTGADFQEPHECQGCERQGPFRLNVDQSEFVDAQSLRIQESPEGLQGGETPRSIDVRIEDDLTGEVTPGDHVTVTGVLRIDQSGDGQDQSAVFDTFMEGIAVEIEDEQFEDMEITEEDKKEIVRLSDSPDIYEQMVDSIAPSIYGYEQQKLAMALQLFSGVTKHLPDGTRLRGDLHILFIGDPGTGKCVRGDTPIRLGDGSRVPIREVVEANLDDPKPVDDGVYDDVDLPVPTMTPDGRIVEGTATKVWKREAPDRLYRIRTASGTELTTTPSHPLFVPARNDAEDGVGEGSDGGNGVEGGSDGGVVDPVRVDELSEGDAIVAVRDGEAGIGDRKRVRAGESRIVEAGDDPDVVAPDGGSVRTGVEDVATHSGAIGSPDSDLRWDRIERIEQVVPEDEWVYDLEVAGTHSYVSGGIVSHNSQMLQYVKQISPRAVYTSGKGASSAGLTAAAVKDDFGDGQQWSLEAGALVLADQGIAAVDELDKMRCVTGDTLVHCGDGAVRRIDDLAREAAESGEIERLENGRTIREVDLRVSTMADDGRIVERPVTAVHEYETPDDLRTVTVESGQSVTATADHPFFVLEDGATVERAADDLSEGDWVFVPRPVSEAETDGGVAAADGASGTAGGSVDNDGTLSPERGSILGYLAGDGNVFYDREEGCYGVRFTNKEEELLADFERACRAAFDAEPTRPDSEQRTDGVETVRLTGKEYADELLAAGLRLGTYDEKRVPEAVAAAPRETKAAFVRALADAEGNVDDRKVTISSSSYDLLLGTKALLLELGVSSQIQTRERDRGRDLYKLVITAADSLATFERRVGFTLDRKRRGLESVCEAADGDRTILDVVPDCGELLCEARESLRLYQRETGIDGGTYCAFENGEANLSIHRGERVLERFQRRKRTAARDLSTLQSPCSWEELEAIRNRYHVSQSDLAEEIGTSQASISTGWGQDERLRSSVRSALQGILEDVAATDLTRLETLVRGDVKWRRVTSVESTAPERNDDRDRVLEQRIADLLELYDERSPAERARELLERDLDSSTFEELQSELDRWSITHRAVADEIGVDQSTVSRWFDGAVEGDFEAAKDATRHLIGRKRSKVRSLVDEIRDRRTPHVYDLTVEATQNFVGNGFVIHNSEDRSAMHQALEQQEISISKAGINATLKSRCALLGAANPKYGRFDQYEPIGEQIDLEPALISRFDLIFTVTDQPDEEEDRRLAEHILTTNYAGELNTQRTEMVSPDVSREEVESFTDEVDPAIGPDLFRKYVAYAKQNCHPRMTEAAREQIKEFYTDLRAKGTDEDAPVPVTARKLEAIVRLAEASARIRLSDEVTEEDAKRVIDIVRSCLQDVGVDPETEEFDADVVETGTSKSQRDRIKNLKGLIADIEEEYEDGAPVEVVLDRADEIGLDRDKAEHEIDKLKQKGEVYEPSTDHLRTT